MIKNFKENFKSQLTFEYDYLSNKRVIEHAILCYEKKLVNILDFEVKMEILDALSSAFFG